jgi:hypothetical protein
MKTRLFSALAAFALLFAVSGCKSNTSTPAAPTTPQATVLKYTVTGATVVNAAAHTLVVLCTVQLPATSPTLDSTTCSSVKSYLTIAENTFNAIATEAASSDPWPTARVKIALIAAQMATSASVTSPVVKAEIESLESLVAAIIEVQ